MRLCWYVRMTSFVDDISANGLYREVPLEIREGIAILAWIIYSFSIKNIIINNRRIIDKYMYLHAYS